MSSLFVRRALEQHGENEARQAQHPTPAPGLLDEAEQPFQAKAAQPTRRARDIAGHKIKGAAHTHRHRYLETRRIAGDPFVLYRRAEGDEEQVSATGVDFLDEGVFFRWRRAAAGRADAAQARVLKRILNVFVLV